MKSRSGSIFRDESKCEYIKDGRTATLEYMFANGGSIRNFHYLLSMGYRRWGNIFYRNTCKDCSACLPIRVKTEAFLPSKSQKRTLKLNTDIRVEISGSELTDEKLELYRKYLFLKHDKYEANDMRLYESLLALHYGYPFIREMDYYLGDKLIGVGIVDEAEDALSSNYFYYDTDYLNRRLGIFSLLHEISTARSLGKKYHYLGFHIEENPKMSYKKDFRPNEIYVKGEWREFLK